MSSAGRCPIVYVLNLVASHKGKPEQVNVILVSFVPLTLVASCDHQECTDMNPTLGQQGCHYFVSHT